LGGVGRRLGWLSSEPGCTAHPGAGGRCARRGFGDIGTSPIYALQTLFNPSDPHPVAVHAQNVYGVVSLVFWTVMIIVTVTYVWRWRVWTTMAMVGSWR
jgi:hypothetical protein